MKKDSYIVQSLIFRGQFVKHFLFLKKEKRKKEDRQNRIELNNVYLEKISKGNDDTERGERIEKNNWI